MPSAPTSLGRRTALPSVAVVVGTLATSLLIAGCTSSTPGSQPSLPSAPPASGTASSPASASAPTTAVSSLGSVSHPAPPAASSAAPVRTAGEQHRTAALPQPAHIVVVMMENKPYEEIIGNPAAPYLNSLAAHGALLTRSYAITHPSQPNYVALFSGSTQGLVDDSCPHSFTGPNLAGELIQAHRSFTGYAEDLPSVGYTGCSHGLYARKHAPWVDFPAIPGSASQPFTAFPHSYAALPTVAFVIPNLDHDMHNGTISQGDQWLQRNLAGYASWAGTHNSLLVITWDEDDGSASNHITTIVAGDHVRPGRYGEHVTHYRVLRTLQALYGLPPVGASAATTPITDIWR